MYNATLDATYNLNKMTRSARNEKAEYAWPSQQEPNRHRAKGTKRIGNAHLQDDWVTTIPNDMHVDADGLTIKTKDRAEIYPKIVTFDSCRKKYAYR